MCHSVQGSANQTRCWVFGGALSNAFAFDAILLRGEGKGDIVCGEELREWACCGVECASVASEHDVTQAERCGVVVCSRVAIFSWTEQEVKGNPEHVCDALLTGVSADGCAIRVVKDGMGIGLTRDAGGSSLLYERSWRSNQKSVLPKLLWQGSLDPNRAIVWSTARM